MQNAFTFLLLNKPILTSDKTTTIMQTHSTVITIFEGHYHKGVAALVNSLYAHAYEGIIWVAYKGTLPPWAKIDSNTEGIEKMIVRDNLMLHFVRFPANLFLPYAKPNLLLDIFDKYMPTVENVFYLDCDIVVKCRFSYFEEWAKCGIALCEDIFSPFSSSHPQRLLWAKYFEKYNIVVKNKDNQYVNGGFIGLNRQAKSFLYTWKQVQELMLEDFKEISTLGVKDPTYLFHKTDQDALNIAKDITEETLSIADPTAMDLSAGFGYVMSHAIGKNKPWQKNWLLQVIKYGQRPTMTDRLFMTHTASPINIYNNNERWRKQMHIKIASAVARVIS